MPLTEDKVIKDSYCSLIDESHSITASVQSLVPGFGVIRVVSML